MARHAVNRKFQILCKKVNKHQIHDPQLQQHRVRFGATVLWLFQACPGIDSFNAAWVEPLIPSSFPFLLSLLQYMPCSLGLSLSCSNFLKKLLQFSKKVAQKLLQNSKSCSKVAPKSKSFSKVAFYFWV